MIESAVAVGVGAAASLLLAFALTGWPAPWRPLRENYAGRPVPVVLGVAVVGGTLLGALASKGPPSDGVGLALWAGLAALLVAGMLDDRVRDGPRGIAGHLRSLSRGRPTTGILKLIVAVAAGAGVALAAGGQPVRVAAGTVLIALAVNLFNALDVVPGRSLKWGVVALAATLAWLWGDPRALLPAAGLGAAAAALGFDLRERGMLGDGGSNPLGLLVGAALLLALPTAGVVGAAALLLLLQVAAETVTISRLVDRVPPVRWFDRLGRRAG